MSVVDRSPRNDVLDTGHGDRRLRPPRSRIGLLSLWLALLAILVPSPAAAVTPYSLHWERAGAPGSCTTVALGKHDGEPFFEINGTPLPTYEIPGAFMSYPDGSETTVAEAGFDSVLLRTGDNDVHFSVFAETGDDSCVLAREVVHLVCEPLGIDKPLWDLVRDGTPYDGSTRVDLSLAEINPPLAKDIAALEVALASERATLFARAAEVEQLGEKLAMLDQLDAELRDLVNRPLDEITQEDLDAILDRYSGVVDETTRAALEQLLQDVKKSVEDLRAELASLIEHFGEQADATVDLLTSGASESGFDPEDPWGYTLSASDVPPVQAPDVSGVPGAFDADHDPYAAYADAVIEALSDTVAGGAVMDRAEFVAQVRAWRANAQAIGKALAEDVNTSQAETNAYLKAETKVLAYVHQFMTAQGWFNDSTIPADVRATVDGVLHDKFAELSELMKDALNIPGPDSIDLTDTRLFKTIVAFGGAMSAIDEEVTPYADMMVSLVQASERIAIGFVPVVGPMLDFCEAVTGRAWCLKDGEELSTEQRIFSGLGVAVGSAATFWGAGVKNAGVGAKAAEVAEDIAKVDEAIAIGVRARPGTLWGPLRGAVAGKLANEAEIKAAKALSAEGHWFLGFGDKAVHDMLGMPKQSRPRGIEARACDFFSISPGGKIHLTEVKAGLTNEGDVMHAVTQVTNTVASVQAKGLIGKLERVQLAFPKGVELPGSFGVKDGYLVKIIGGKVRTVRIEEVPGVNNVFVRIKWL